MILANKNKILLDFAYNLSYKQRIIFSDEGNLHSRYDIKEYAQDIDNKPNGLWYSMGKSWIDFLLDEDESWAKKRLNRITHIYELKLDTKFLIRNFDGYKTRNGYNWAKIAEKYKGVEVVYKQYKGWDCSSGCIFEREIVKDIKLLMSWEVEFKQTF